MKAKGAVIYCRVSTGEQAKSGTSLENQREICRAKAESLGIPIVAEYEDAGVSGGFLLLREGMQAALADITAGRANTLICANLSRYSRDVEHQQAIKKQVRNAGGRVVFADMDFDDTPEGDLAFNVLGGFAAYERANIRKRMMDGKRRRAINGYQPSRSVSPFGYHIPTVADVIRGDYPHELLGRYVIIEEKAAIVRRMFDQYAAGGCSLRTIARELQCSAVPTPQGGEFWRVTSVRSILRNPVYKGEPAYGRLRSRADENRLQQVDPRTGRPLTSARYQRPNDARDWVALDAPALVDTHTWEIVQRILDNNQSLKGGNPSRVRMLSGRVLCPVCGGRMVQAAATYVCSAYRRKTDAGLKVCSATQYSAEEIEELVKTALVDACHNTEAIKAAAYVYCDQKDRKPQSGDVDEIASIEADLKEVAAEELAAVKSQIAGVRSGIAPEVYADILADIASRRQALEVKLAQLQSVKCNVVERAPAIPGCRMSDVVERALADLTRMLSSVHLTGEEKRGAVGKAIQSVVPRKSKVGMAAAQYLADVTFVPGLLSGCSDIPDTVQSTSMRFML